MQDNRIYKKISLLALFTAFAIILSYVESFIPVIGIPGVKLGLANFAIVIALYLFGAKDALIINILRIMIVGAMFGNLFSILFSIAGALISFLSMFVAKKTEKISIVTVAVLGGVFHNVGQIIVAFFVVENYAVYIYLPVLILAGIITGAIIGSLSNVVYYRVKKYVKRLEN